MGDAEELNNGCSPPPEMIENADLQIEAIEKSLPVNELYDVPLKQKQKSRVFSKEMYQHMHWRSLYDSDNFWREMAYENIDWIEKFTKVSSGSLVDGDVCWFLNGKLNACANCVDRWAEKYPHRTAIIWEGDEPTDVKYVTYKQLHVNVCKFANTLKFLGVRKGDTVAIYMPMIPEAVYAMLACARIGAAHNVVFAGFSATSLRDRIHDAGSRILITADQGSRGGKIIPLKSIADEALKECKNIRHCVVFKHKGLPINFIPERDIWGHMALKKMRPYCPLEVMDSEDFLFILYTSGSTGKPKGIAHTTAGYLLYAALTHKYVFDIFPGDVFACVADIGWITGHSYVVYGPLCNGVTTLLFESVPTYPDAGRYWSLIERHNVTQFYTSPTAIRALMRCGDTWPAKHNLSSLRVLGSVGEPINPDAWRWYYDTAGRRQCSVVDTYWQTETGGHVLSPLPGAIKTKPGSASVPFFGIEPVILDCQSGRLVEGDGVHGVLCFRRSWPGMMRTVFGAHNRMVATYLQPYPGYYFTGDGAVRDKDGYYWITGRVDDTINVSGHRLGAAEIEHALVQHASVIEAAVVGYPHDLKGVGIFCFVTLKEDAAGKTDYDSLIVDLKQTVRNYIGPIATPDIIALVSALPKTRSGKIMRRILRKLAAQSTVTNFGDISTLANPEAVEEISKAVHTALTNKKSKVINASNDVTNNIDTCASVTNNCTTSNTNNNL